MHAWHTRFYCHSLNCNDVPDGEPDAGKLGPRYKAAMYGNYVSLNLKVLPSPSIVTKIFHTNFRGWKV